MLARAEWRRRKLTKRLKEEEERIEEDEAETRKRLKSSREHHKKWEETRETRVGTWRDFAKKKGKKARQGFRCRVQFVLGLPCKDALCPGPLSVFPRPQLVLVPVTHTGVRIVRPHALPLP